MHTNNSANSIGTVARIAAALLLSLAALTPSLAQVSRYDEKQVGNTNEKPNILNGVGIAQHLNQQLPLDLTFTDETGKPVQLATYFGKKPAILALVYYQCPMLCS